MKTLGNVLKYAGVLSVTAGTLLLLYDVGNIFSENGRICKIRDAKCLKENASYLKIEEGSYNVGSAGAGIAFLGLGGLCNRRQTKANKYLQL